MDLRPNCGPSALPVDGGAGFSGGGARDPDPDGRSAPPTARSWADRARGWSVRVGGAGAAAVTPPLRPPVPGGSSARPFRWWASQLHTGVGCAFRRGRDLGHHSAAEMGAGLPVERPAQPVEQALGTPAGQRSDRPEGPVPSARTAPRRYPPIRAGGAAGPTSRCRRGACHRPRPRAPADSARAALTSGFPVRGGVGLCTPRPSRRSARAIREAPWGMALAPCMNGSDRP